MSKKRDITLIKKFKERIKKEFPITKLILFGSRAKGKAKRWSDFDLMIVSNKFKGIGNLKRGIEFYDYWDEDYPVDFVCLTDMEFNKLKNKATLVKEAIKEGIEIK